MSVLRPSRRRRGLLRAFTLAEMLITLGAGLLIALALASMFQTAGDTVSAGQRLSRFNRVASLIEQQMREDFASITRDGFLVIRHEIAHDHEDPDLVPVKVPLFRGQPKSERRFRRTDEIVFFKRGRFNSARPALAPGITASGNAARIYYGHGARMDPTLNESYVRVPAYDLGLSSGGLSPRETMGWLGEVDTPNEFASEWTLLRHVTVLSQPNSALQALPQQDDFFGIDDETAMRDAERQIGLQPAMPSIFRHENFAWSNDAPRSDTHLREGNSDGYDRDEPWYMGASGLLDVATTDLAEIRSRVTSSHREPLTGGTPPTPTDLISPVDITTVSGTSGIQENRPASWHPRLDPNQSDDLAYLFNMQAWMRQAFPGDSNADDATISGALEGVRMRAETTPPGVGEILSDPGTYQPDEFETADRLNDQTMLIASNLAVRCSEFKVEWSFGQTYTGPGSGDLIWYGSDVRDDTEVALVRYSSNTMATPHALRIDVRTGRFLPREASTLPLNEFHLPLDRLIHGDFGRPTGARFATSADVGPQPPAGSDTTVLYSYFGYNDPTYDPDDGTLPADALDQLPWPWPKLIRVTLTLVDENDPELEQTFQFVFEVGQDN